MKKPLLMIITSHSRLGSTGKTTGLWFEELTTPYYTFVDAGIDVTLASVLGGTPPLADGSVKTNIDENKGSVQRFLKDSKAMAQLNSTLKCADLNPDNFSGVFLPGGHGTMWDTAIDDATAMLVAATFNANRPVAAVCHGPAGLVNAKRADGQSILAGRRVNGFTNAEETAAGLMDVVPFHLETRMRELGGVFESGPLWQAFAVRDGNLITGQNPASSEKVAMLTLEALQPMKEI
jgi:putative intracellular protease/amidase